MKPETKPTKRTRGRPRKGYERPKDGRTRFPLNPYLTQAEYERVLKLPEVELRRRLLGKDKTQ